MSDPLSELLSWIFAVDAATVDLVVTARTPVLTKVMTSVTGLGSASAVAVFLGLSHLAGWDREARVGTIAMVCSGLVVVSLMAAVQRPFPPQPVCVTDGSGVAPHSFPSGHAAAVTVYALVARDSARLPTAVVVVISLLVAVSRIYLGTHYLSDTVVGVLIGAGAYIVAEWALGRYGWPTLDR